YLSRDPVFDARTDVYLGYTDHNGNVAPNATYTGMNSFRVPRGLSGTYYVFAVADASDNVYERANEGNNVGRSVGTVAVTLAPPADLVAGTITIPANAVAGSEVSLTYTVRNSGANAARGSWFDSLYISGDTSFDIGDLLIGRVGHAGDLGPNQSYTATLEAPLPGMPPGEYHVILRSDIRNHINESNEANNVSASIDDVTVTVPALTLGQPVTGTLGAGKAAFYRVEVAAGEALLFTFDSANNSGVNELYVSHGEVPSRSAFDLAFSAAATADQEIMVPFTEAGTYYVMAYGAVGAASTYTLKAEIVPFAVRSIDPGEVGNAGSVTLEIKGARFTDDTVFQAVDPSGAVINPTRVIFNDSSSVYATFDLTGKAVGAYDVRATNPGNQVTQLDNQLNVVIGRGAHITAAINGPAVLRVDVNYVAYIDFVNDGDSDAAVPAFVIRNDSGTPIGFSRDSIAPVSSLQILGNEDGALGGILRPGERRSLPFYFTAKPIPQVNLELLTISETDTTPIDYAIVEATLRSHDLVPAELTLAEFETAFAALKTQIGGTWGDYIKTLSRNAGLVPEAEGSTRSAVPMLGVEFRRALAATGTSLTGTLRSNHAALDAAGQLVTAVNLTTGDSYSSFALNDGSFIFGRVAAGDYRFEVDGALVSSGATALVASGESLTGLNLGIESGGTIRGTAVKSGTNEVLANATVRLVSADGRLRSVQTDENGAYVLTGLAAGTYDLSANAEGRARLSMDDIVVSSPTGTLVRPLSFAAEAVIKSSVIFQTGGPASVLRVDVTDVADPTRVFTATVTDQTYSVGQLAAGTYRLTFSAEGYITSSRDVTVAAQQTALVDSTTLLRGATAAGVVSSADPTVAAAFSLVGLYQGDTLVAAEQASATGAFKFSELAPGTYTLRIAPGNAAYSTTQTFTVTAGQDVADQNLQLSPGGTVFGKVRNPGGTPLSGVEVFLTNAAGALISAISGADGSYRFTGLGLGTYTTFVNAPGSAAANSQVTSLTGAPITADLSVAAIATLGGKLQSAAGGQIAGIVSLLLDGLTVASTRTDAAGNYLFLIERAGTYTVQASAARASFDPSAPIAVANGSAIQQTLSSGTGRVSLTLTDALQAVEGASVLLNRVLGDGSIATAGSATVGADGAATFENLAAGNYRVSVTGANNRAGTVSTAVAAGATASINAALTQQSALQGRITGTGGAPVANVSVVLRSTVDGSIEGVGATNAAGDYDLTHVAPGIYELIAVAAGFQALVLPSVTVGAAPTTFDAALTISTTKLRGQALTADGQPLRVGLVTVSDAAGRTLGVAGLNNDGTFEVDSASGTGLRVKIAAEGFVAAQQTGVNVTAGTTQTIAALTLEGAALGASTSVRAALPGQPGVLPPVIAFGQARERFEALGNGDLLGFLKSLFAAFEKNDDHISFGDVPEPCSDEAAAATLSERIKLLNSIGLQNDAFEAISPRQNTLRYSTLLLSLELLAASVDTAAQGTLILASILPLGKLIKEGGALARGEDLVEATATFRQASVELFSAIVGIEENVRQLLSDFNGVTATIYGFAEADSPSDLAGQVDAAIKDINAMAGLAVEIGTRFATLMKDDVAGKALSILGPFVGPIGALASIPGYLASIRNNTQQLRGTVQTINTEYELLKGSVEQYETFVDVANRRLTEYILALEKADCDPDDPRDDDEDDDGIPDDEDDDDNSDDPDGPFGPGGSGGGGSGAGYNPPVTTPKDPNDIIGPVGFGEDRWVNVTTPMHYMIRYENAPEATAPAQEVLITQQLDPDLDWRTFRLEDFGWGDVVVELQGNQSFYSGRVDLMETKGFVVDVTAFIDIQTGLATWTLTTIDPATGEKPIDATLGFLPPDVPNGVGDGFVNYTIRPLRTAETGARIDAKASIIFDTNEPIDTPPIFNTIDSTKPTSGINPLAALTNNTNFQVSWTSADPSGSAVKEVDVYVSDNGAPASLWLGKTELREATYAGESGHTYTFHTLARDNAGNEQSFATAAKVSTLVTGLGNTDPVAQANRALQIQEDAVTALGITAPTDADNDALFILVNTLPDATKGVIRRADNTLVEAGDLLTVAQLMALTFTPIANISGPAGSFSYTVNDGQGGTATQTITLAVVDENDPPTVQPNKTVELLEDAAATPLGITAPSDSEGDALIITVTSLPDVLKGQVRLADGTPVAAGALLTIQQLLELQFLPAPNAFGPAGTFVYSVADSLGGTAAQTVTLVVTGVNDAPIVGESQTTRALTNTALGLVAPVDPDGDALSVVVTTLPDPAMGQITLANGSAVTLGANLSAEELVGLRYAPAAGAIGNAGAFAFSVSDGTAAAVVQTITLVNVPFVTFDKKNPLIFTDADGDKVTVTLKGEGSGFARFEGDASDNADLGSLVLTGTDAKSGLKVSVKQTGGLGTTRVAHISTNGDEQGLGSLVLDSSVTLGTGEADAAAEILIGGGIKTLTLGDIAANATIRLGADLDASDTAKVAALNPSVKFGNVLGANVTLDVRGGLKGIAGESWSFPGSISTLQSIGGIKLAGDFGASLAVDAASVATGVANVGAISVGGAYTGTTTIVEGSIKTLTAKGLLSSAISTVGIGNVSAAQIVQTTLIASGDIGNITAMLKDATGTVIVIDRLSVVAGGEIGKISAAVKGTSALTSAVGIQDSNFASGGSIGGFAISGTSKNAAATFAGIASSEISAQGSVGKITAPSATDLRVFTGGALSSVEVKSGKN
ncbi:MAG TPA: carboxypeptidase regulatory-like domain-containing protein, partial [Chthoniobacteraceae bacterium]|nr:carboxypeptidase regulatory-like domain-containing protein [Chthoniobacteraceae bacterium]